MRGFHIAFWYATIGQEAYWAYAEMASKAVYLSDICPMVQTSHSLLDSVLPITLLSSDCSDHLWVLDVHAYLQDVVLHALCGLVDRARQRRLE